MVTTTRSPRTTASLLVVCILVVGLVLSPITAVTAQENSSTSPPTQQDIELRDELIAAQESLLNVYRCKFAVDIRAVPGGCKDRRPAQGPTEPEVFEGTPTQNDINVRDDLIARQETLLNAYRCRFNIDTHIVPDRCRGTEREVRIDWARPPGCSPLLDSLKDCAFEYTVQLIGPWREPPYRLQCVAELHSGWGGNRGPVIVWEDHRWSGEQDNRCTSHWADRDQPFVLDGMRVTKAFIDVDGIKSNELDNPRQNLRR